MHQIIYKWFSCLSCSISLFLSSVLLPQIFLDANAIRLGNIPLGSAVDPLEGAPAGTTYTKQTVYELCACANGKLYLSPAEKGSTCQTTSNFCLWSWKQEGWPASETYGLTQFEANASQNTESTWILAWWEANAGLHHIQVDGDSTVRNLCQKYWLHLSRRVSLANRLNQCGPHLSVMLQYLPVTQHGLEEKRSYCQLEDQMLIDRCSDGWHNGHKKPTCGHDATVAPLMDSVTLKVWYWCCRSRRHDDLWNSWITGVPDCSSILIQVIVGSVFTVSSTCSGKRILVCVRINRHGDGRQICQKRQKLSHWGCNS